VVPVLSLNTTERTALRCHYPDCYGAVAYRLAAQAALLRGPDPRELHGLSLPKAQQGTQKKLMLYGVVVGAGMRVFDSPSYRAVVLRRPVERSDAERAVWVFSVLGGRPAVCSGFYD